MEEWDSVHYSCYLLNSDTNNVVMNWFYTDLWLLDLVLLIAHKFKIADFKSWRETFQLEFGWTAGLSNRYSRRNA